MRMSEGGGFQWGYFEKQLCICVSKGMSTVSEEVHTPVSHVLVLLVLHTVLSLFPVHTSRAVPDLCGGLFSNSEEFVKTLDCTFCTFCTILL